MKSDYKKLTDKAMWIFDKFYELVCRDVDCTYCTFYRGVLVGVILGSIFGLVVQN
ncbi:hypothetical protein V757_02930 [Pelistega indica]|uniref:Uncharacterized protein n=1 Tax=Pelistega indica TaxID=1414851 RepID=V8GAE2_9BURK|nr:hypothetical protein V757_02930 [Pelistega indica]